MSVTLRVRILAFWCGLIVLIPLTFTLLLRGNWSEVALLLQARYQPTQVDPIPPAFVLLLLALAASISTFFYFLDLRPNTFANFRATNLLAASACAVLSLWVLNWTRFDFLTSLQIHLFTPLWLSFIALLTALKKSIRGGVAEYDSNSRLLLFPISAALWWLFELLNRFCGNWEYNNIDALGNLEYSIFASLAFSTVLPALLAMKELLGQFLTLNPRAKNLLILNAKFRSPFLMGLVALVGFYALCISPDSAYPLLWLSPLLLLIFLKQRAMLPTLLDCNSERSILDLFLWALSGLACGFFWELWNFASLARWEYHLPGLEFFYLFEMPVVGFLGYLPFGILCGEIVLLIRPSQPTAHKPGDRFYILL